MLLTIAVAEDFKEWRISNRLICAGLLWGLVFRIMGDGGAGIVHFLMNISIPVILLFLLFQMRALGAGDIKLISMTGGFLSTRQLLYIIPVAFLAAAIIGVGKLVCRRTPLCHFGNQRTQIHFSPAILIAYLIVVWGCAIV
ncbi:MAG: prepilin peptidase [Clostridiales bacterium]|nr:prepilin peptidase [Clostridiales bacterium]